jgi:hypothetical protein
MKGRKERPWSLDGCIYDESYTSRLVSLAYMPTLINIKEDMI